MDSTKKSRVGKRELKQLLASVSEKDKVLLESLSSHRYLLTGQLQRLHFRDSTSKLAALKATNRCLARLQDLGLIASLDRRIGGGQGRVIIICLDADPGWIPTARLEQQH